MTQNAVAGPVFSMAISRTRRGPRLLRGTAEGIPS